MTPKRLVADMMKAMQKYFHDSDPCGDVLKRDMDLAITLARPVLEEAARRVDAVSQNKLGTNEIRMLLAEMEALAGKGIKALE